VTSAQQLQPIGGPIGNNEQVPRGRRRRLLPNVVCGFASDGTISEGWSKAFLIRSAERPILAPRAAPFLRSAKFYQFSGASIFAKVTQSSEYQYNATDHIINTLLA
jgi:hypothetical protein